MKKKLGRPHSRSGANTSPTLGTMAGGQGGISFDLHVLGEIGFWRACFISALRGSTAAQRKLPSPKLLAHWAGIVADCGLDEERHRQQQFKASTMKSGGVVLMLLLSLLNGCGGSKSPTAPSSPTVSRIIGLEADLAFGDVEVGKTLDRQLHVINSGTAPLTISGMTGPEGYSASPTSGVVQPGQFLNVTVRFSPTEPRTYNGTLTVNGDQTSGTNTKTISGRGLGPPFKRTGTGANVFDIPSSVSRIHIVADYGGSCENFIVHINGRSIVNEILGRCSVAIGPHYEGTHLINNGGTTEVKFSSGVNWLFEEVR